MFSSNTTIVLSTTISLPKDYPTVADEFTTHNTRRVKLAFNIPATTPFCDIYDVAYSAYTKATKPLRISIAKYHVTIATAKLKDLKRL